jgi:hypothetical protein
MTLFDAFVVAGARRKAYSTIQSHKSVSEKEWCEKRCYAWLGPEEDQKTLKELSFGTILRFAPRLPGRNLLYVNWCGQRKISYRYSRLKA